MTRKELTKLKSPLYYSKDPKAEPKRIFMMDLEARHPWFIVQQNRPLQYFLDEPIDRFYVEGVRLEADKPAYEIKGKDTITNYYKSEYQLKQVKARQNAFKNIWDCYLESRMSKTEFLNCINVSPQSFAAWCTHQTIGEKAFQKIDTLMEAAESAVREGKKLPKVEFQRKDLKAAAERLYRIMGMNAIQKGE